MFRAKLFPAFLAALTYVLLSIAPAHVQGQQAYHHPFSNAAKWAQSFDNPKRDEWQKPHEVIRALAIKPDDVIADIGSGTGYFSVRFARMATKGSVYGVDTSPDMVKYLAERAKRDGLKNLISVEGAPDDARLPEKVDLVVLVDAYHHIDQRESYFRRLRASLKPGGRVAIIDFRMDSPDGPPKSMRVTPDGVDKELSAAGYKLVHNENFLPRQYFLIFQLAEK